MAPMDYAQQSRGRFAPTEALLRYAEQRRGTRKTSRFGKSGWRLLN